MERKEAAAPLALAHASSMKHRHRKSIGLKVCFILIVIVPVLLLAGTYPYWHGPLLDYTAIFLRDTVYKTMAESAKQSAETKRKKWESFSKDIRSAALPNASAALVKGDSLYKRAKDQDAIAAYKKAESLYHNEIKKINETLQPLVLRAETACKEKITYIRNRKENYGANVKQAAANMKSIGQDILHLLEIEDEKKRRLEDQFKNQEKSFELNRMMEKAHLIYTSSAPAMQTAQKSYISAKKYLKNKIYDKALIAFKEAAALFSQIAHWHPEAEKLLSRLHALHLKKFLRQVRHQNGFVFEPFFRHFEEKQRDLLSAIGRGDIENALARIDKLDADIHQADRKIDVRARTAILVHGLNSFQPDQPLIQKTIDCLKKGDNALFEHEWDKARSEYEKAVANCRKVKAVSSADSDSLPHSPKNIDSHNLQPTDSIAWSRARDKNTSETLKAFIQKYPKSSHLEEARQLLVKATAKALLAELKQLGLAFVYIHPGTFSMGSPTDELGRNMRELRHRVTINNGFYLQRTEVTQGLWKKVLGNNPSHFGSCGDTCPVENISWDDVQQFIARLNHMAPPNRYRLPTEAEWEYACRSGSITRFSFGNSVSQLDDYAWHYTNAGAKTHPVARKQANAWGLYDMHGNVWEWCQDRYEAYPSGAVTDPSGAAAGSLRVLRGGSWHNYAWFCRSALRNNLAPSHRLNNLGFRLVLIPGK